MESLYHQRDLHCVPAAEVNLVKTRLVALGHLEFLSRDWSRNRHEGNRDHKPPKPRKPAWIRHCATPMVPIMTAE